MENSTNFLSNVNNSQKFIYHFDWPGLQESGFVEISKTNIMVVFPEKTSLPQNVSDICNYNVLLFINNQLKFSYQWLPVYTLSDYYKVQEMLCKCLYEFKKLCSVNELNDIQQLQCIYLSNYCNEIITSYENNNIKIYCFEDYTNTSLEININKQTEYIDIENKFDIQFYIGKHQILKFSDLNLNSPELYDLFSFLLYKLIKL